MKEDERGKVPLEKDGLDISQPTARLIQALSRQYESVYEADLYKNDICVWKENGTIGPVYKKGGLEPFIRVVQDRYVHLDYRKAFEQTFGLDSVKKAFEEGKTEVSMDLPARYPKDGKVWYSMEAHLMERTEDSMHVIVYVKNISSWRAEEVRQQAVMLEALQLMKAVSSTYDMLISVNLTRNSYYMIGYDKFLNHSAKEEGNFDQLIQVGSSTIPEPYKKQFLELFSRESLLKAYDAGKASVYLEHLQAGEDGKLHWVSTLVMFTENPYNNDIMEITLSRCIDDIREKEERNKQALKDALHVAEQASHAKTDFLSRISHDIRTPMNAIIGMTSIAFSNLENREKVEDCLKKIGSSSHYLLSLLNDVLDLSRIESGKMPIAHEPFHLRKMIQSLASMNYIQAKEKEQEFTVDIAPDVGQMYMGDELRLRQVLMNLLSNACKYTQKGGRFSLKVSQQVSGPEHMMVQFAVEDNGIGITDSFKEHIFDAFSQDIHGDGRNGSGLGLAITQNLVRLMGGVISVKSQYGKGSCFTAEIPLVPMEKLKGESPGMPEDGEEISFEGQRVLLAEDNELNQEIAVTLLEMKGLKVEAVSDGREACRRFAASEPGYYQALLMDIQMPVMNGYEAAEAIRAMDRQDAGEVPIYAMTANAFSGDVAKCVASGMNGHVSKPVDFEALAVVLKHGMQMKNGGKDDS